MAAVVRSGGSRAASRAQVATDRNAFKESVKARKLDAAARKLARKARGKPDAAAQEAWQLILDLLFSDLVLDRMHTACDAVDLSPGLAKALFLLEPGEARPMGEYAATLRCDASYATSLVDGLENKGLVARRILPSDRRVRTVVLTPAGVEARQRWRQTLSELPAGFGELGGADATMLRDLLRNVVSGVLRRAADKLDTGNG